MKKFLSTVLYFLISSVLFAASYRIDKVEYVIDGQTKRYALETKEKVDKKKIFSSEDELVNYIEDYKMRLNNLRAFEEIKTDFTVGKEDEKGITSVNLLVYVEDSHHLLLVPYPKYSSSSGLNVKIKARDSNFLGTLETMSSDFHLEMCGSNPNPVIGFQFDFDVPFKLSIFDAVWTNSVAIDYEAGQSSPSWDLNTGLKLTKDFGKFSIVNQFKQASVRKVEYDFTTDDGTIETIDQLTYFTENYMLALPITLQEIPNWGKVLYTPAATFVANWTADDIDDSVRDSIVTQGVGLMQSIGTARINWIGNFRNGFAGTLMQSYTYAFTNNTYTTGFSAELYFYKAFEIPIKDKTFNFGINSRIYGFANLKGYSSFGDRLRGIVSSQKFDADYPTDLTDTEAVTDYFLLTHTNACSSKTAIVINVDFPIKLGTIHWADVPIANKIKYSKYFDMEVQISPFIDFAIFQNKATGTIFNPEDGFLSGGIEGLIFPLKMRGINIRGSIGIDLSRKMPYLKGKFNQDWRDSSVKSYEISIGIGLHY
ncbi:MAG: hypothetical protein K6F15_08895 [Treponema sp.]|nr:hypothetical protein [Treponema sp.]